jgi:hypothetical protein
MTRDFVENCAFEKVPLIRSRSYLNTLSSFKEDFEPRTSCNEPDFFMFPCSTSAIFIVIILGLDWSFCEGISKMARPLNVLHKGTFSEETLV